MNRGRVKREMMKWKRGEKRESLNLMRRKKSEKAT